MKEHAFRLVKGDDLKKSLEKYTEDNDIRAGVIISCVGCLYEAIIRDASGVNCVTLKEKLEIVSITGTLSIDGSHIHISVSDEELKTYGGHLKDGCLVNTTAEIVILELDSYVFERQMDEKTGYKELCISRKQLV
ncbi:MAG: DNA-binding protein [Clostridia bacterium]|nr:DNA-binding protein [Clostridia bacterium]MDD4387004.1 DNA-binding protein [Clostridia bacterium]